MQLAVVHERVEELPVTTDVGRAEKAEIVQSANTVMVTEDVGDCVPLVAVRMYVVVEDGETLVLLFTPTEPTPWLMLALVQFEVDHERPTE